MNVLWQESSVFSPRFMLTAWVIQSCTMLPLRACKLSPQYCDHRGGLTSQSEAGRGASDQSEAMAWHQPLEIVCELKLQDRTRSRPYWLPVNKIDQMGSDYIPHTF